MDTLKNTYKTDFPWLRNHPQLVYLDNAATTHKPQVVIDALRKALESTYAPVHRGIYDVAEQATVLYEEVRLQIARWINATHASEIIFTKGATEGINLVAAAWATHTLKPGDEIVLSVLEHHANIAPWLRLAKERNLVIRWLGLQPEGLPSVVDLGTYFSARTKLLVLTLDSNVIGPLPRTLVSTLIKQARMVGAAVLLDAAQAIAHQPVDMQELDADFLVWSGHKMYGPSGIGVLYLRKSLHEQLKAYQMGGGMVYQITPDEVRWRPMPQLLEAGSPGFEQVIGIGAAISYLQQINWTAIMNHEAYLTVRAITGLRELGCTILGPLDMLKKAGHLVSFTVPGMHAHDVAAYLSQQGICVRAGHHCCQLLHEFFGIGSSVRASFGLYTTEEDIERLLIALKHMLQAY